MAHSYKAPQRDQLFLLPPSIRDWVPEEHLVWFVLDVVSVVDLSRFDERHPNDTVGRRAYDPEMMLALLFYAYCCGLRSSRRIEAAVRVDLAFKAICADLVPDHIAIARFRADHEQAIKDTFIDVLRLCAKAGLASVGVIAIDGTKMAADAALDQNRSESTIRAEVEAIMAQVAAAEKEEAVQPSLAGELPEMLAHRSSRLGRLKAALGEIEAQRQAAVAAEAAATERMAQDAEQGRRPKGKAPADPARAAERARAEVTSARVRHAAARSVLERLQTTADLERAERLLVEAEAAAESAPAPAERQANVVDPESRIMKTHDGWLQGYNAQAAVNASQIVVAAELTNDANDVALLLPLIAASEANANKAGVAGGIGVVLADAGYWSEINATAEGPNRLIATLKDWKQRRAAKQMGTTTGEPPEDASPLEAMEHALRTPEGAELYAQRSYTVEPVFGQAKENRSIRRFMRRGLDAAESEWALICTTGNLLKLYSHAGGRSLAEVIAAAS